MKHVAFITGATKNTGYAIAERFAQEGWDVCLSSRTEESAAQAAKALAAKYPAVCTLGIGMDPASPEEITAAFTRIGERFGRLDAFVSNAAHLAVDYNTFNTTPQMWDDVMNANARGTFLGAQAATKLMKDGGAMVFLSSVHSNQSITGRVAYSASKAAINAIARCMAVELGYLGIRVNALIAGAIHSERWDTQSPEETAKRRLKYPSGRESFPEEIANAVYFLCCDQSLTITGTEMTVDSGISVCLLPYNKEWNKHE